MVFRVAGGNQAAGNVGALGNYALFVSTANQTNPVANTANLTSLDTQIDGASGVTNSSGTITFTSAGIYRVIVELFWTSTTGANPTISQWLVQNGNNMANSTQDFQLLGGANTVQASTCIWQINALANDTLKVYWSCSNTNVSLAYQAALTTPTRPASPSAIVAIQGIG